AIVGLGRMGANMARRLVRAGHRVVGWDRDPSLGAQLEAEGIVSVPTLEALGQALTPPRAVWMMVPAAVTSELAEQLAPLLSAGDTLIDGGNSHYRDAVDRAEALAKKGIYHLDVGTSGGVHGLSRGYCLMIGGD